MVRGQETCLKSVRKNMLTAAGRQILVKTRHFRKPPTQNNHLWVENVDDPGQRLAQSLFIALQGGFAVRVANSGEVFDLRR